MVRKVPITEQRFQGAVDFAPMNVRFNDGAAAFSEAAINTAGAIEKADEEARKKAEIEKTKIDQQFELATKTKMIRDFRDFEKQYPNNPGKLQESIEKYKKNVFSNIVDPEIKNRLAFNFETMTLSSLNRVLNRQVRQNTERLQLGARELINESLTDIREYSSDLFSDDESARTTAAIRIQAHMQDIGNALRVENERGDFIFTPAQIVSGLENAANNLYNSALLGWFENEPNKRAALESIRSGNISINLPTADGKEIQSINVLDFADPQTIGFTEAKAKLAIAEEDQQLSTARTVLYDNLNTAIGLAGDNGEALLEIKQRIDQNSDLFLSDARGIAQRNKLTLKLAKSFEKAEEKSRRQQLGAAFIDGTIAVNPGDKEDRDIFNEYFESITMPELAIMEPRQRTETIANIVSQSKFVPDALKDSLAMASNSVRAQDVIESANTIDSIVARNPHMIDDFKQKDIARANMVRDMITAGYPEDEAFKRVEKLIDPNNGPLIETRKQNLADAKISYQENVLDLFRVGPFNIFGPSIDESNNVQARELANMTAVYQKSYDNHFLLTGDAELAEKHASQVVTGQFSISNVNGFDEIMRFAPERYYQSASESSDEFSKRIKSEIKELTGKDNVILALDPFVTSKTAIQGAPLYRLLEVGEDGTLSPVFEANEFYQPMRKDDVELAKIMRDFFRSDINDIKSNSEAIRSFLSFGEGKLESNAD